MKKIKILGTVSMVAFLAACSVTPQPLTEGDFNVSAEQDLKDMFDQGPEISGEITLSDAIARALLFNLDHKAKAMEQALAVSETDLKNYELLPTLTAKAGYDVRSEVNATNSSTVGSADEPGDYTYSDDKKSFTADLTLGWNMLDFGVSYFNAKQNANRALIAEERRRKVVHNLVKEVQRAYWRMVAAQKLEQRVKLATANARRALQQAEQVESERVRGPETALRFQKNLLDNLRQLENINQELSTARYELAALINVAPGTAFTVSLPARGKLELPKWEASIEEMEKLAFQNNPDLREKMYLSRITADETKKAILSLLPGINLSFGRNFDDNSYLDQNRWFEASSAISWNLFNVFKLPARQKFTEANEELADVQRMALRMALMAQVRVASLQYQNAVNKFEHHDKLYNVDKRLAFHLSKRENTNSQGALDKISQETAAITSELLRYQAYSEVMSAIGRIHSTLGVSVVPETVQKGDVEGLSKAIDAALMDWQTGKSAKSVVEKAVEAEEPVQKPMAKKEAVPVAAPVKAEAKVEKKAETPIVKATPAPEMKAPAKAKVKAKAKPKAPAKVVPTFVNLYLNEGPGTPPAYNVKLSCGSLKEGDKKDGWVELYGKDTEGLNRNGWIHKIYLMQGRLKCQKA